MKRLLTLLLLLPIFATRSQETTETPSEGWPIEQRCLPEPTTPPDDWTFEGTIFLRSYEGIHGIRSDVETPYFVTFGAGEFIGAGAISPDGLWFAVPSGTAEYASNMMIDYYVHVQELRIYGTSPIRQEFSLPWDAGYRVTDPENISRILWLDNDHIAYDHGDYAEEQTTIINPFTGEKEAWSGLPYLLYGYPSPDWTRIIAYREYSWGMFDMKTGEQVRKLPSPSNSFNLNSFRDYFKWNSNSTYSMTHTIEVNNEGKIDSSELRIFDRDGTYTGVVFSLETDSYIPFFDWSTDGNLFAFAVTNNLDNVLYIGDTKNQKIFDTCVTENTTFAWAPDGQQLAYQTFLKMQNLIVVSDIQENHSYIVAHHYGNVVGWRAGE